MVRKIAVILVACFGIMVSSLFAQEAQAQAPALEKTAGKVASSLSENVTLDFKNAEIKSVFKIIAHKSGINIVSTPEVMGSVTVKLKDVPWEEALETIVRAYGFGYEWVNDNVIMVSSLEKLAEERSAREEAAVNEPLDTQTFVLNFTKAEEVQAAVEKLLSERGKITLESRSNTLIITDTKSNLMKIGKIIKRLDKITPQVLIEAKIVETTLGESEKLGIDWTTRISATASKIPTTFPFDRWSAGSKYRPTGKYAANIDAETGAVTVTSDFPFKGDLVQWPNDAGEFAGFPMTDASNFIFGSLDFSELSAVMELLDSRTNTNIVANPSITTLNNKEAKILVGKIVPIPVYAYSKETGTRQIAGYEELEIGTRLLVTPSINDEDYVTLYIKPSVDEILEWTGPDNERPIIATRSAETTVMIKDGETLVIGGLIKSTKVKYKNKFPFLGDIPLLGLLFTKTEDTLTKTDLLIFITPHIIREARLSPEDLP